MVGFTAYAIDLISMWFSYYYIYFCITEDTKDKGKGSELARVHIRHIHSARFLPRAGHSSHDLFSFISFLVSPISKHS